MKSCLKRNNRISARVSDEGRCLSGVSGRTLPKIRLYYLMTIFHDKMIFTSLKYWLTQNDITSSRPTPETLSLHFQSFSVSAAFYLARSLNISLVLGLKSGKFCLYLYFKFWCLVLAELLSKNWIAYRRTLVLFDHGKALWTINTSDGLRSPFSKHPIQGS